MPRAELAITIPESVWMGELSRAHPDTGFEILTAFPREGGGVALAEITADDVEAVEAGYYDTPRDCTLTDLAETVGLAKSTCSETLHRAEGQIIKQFVAESSTDGPDSLRP